MKFIKPNVSAGPSLSGGHVGLPQSQEWRKEWLENKRRWAVLECGNVIDIVHDRSLIIINKFPRTQVYCEVHQCFVYVREMRETKQPPMTQPDEPLF